MRCSPECGFFRGVLSFHCQGKFPELFYVPRPPVQPWLRNPLSVGLPAKFRLAAKVARFKICGVERPLKQSAATPGIHLARLSPGRIFLFSLNYHRWLPPCLLKGVAPGRHEPPLLRCSWSSIRLAN